MLGDKAGSTVGPGGALPIVDLRMAGDGATGSATDHLSGERMLCTAAIDRTLFVDPSQPRESIPPDTLRVFFSLLTAYKSLPTLIAVL